METTPPRKKKVHHLKTYEEYFSLILRGRKTFELRKDDRDFQQGDTVILMETDKVMASPMNPEGYTGRRIMFDIAGVNRNLESFGLKEGFCIISFLYDFITVYDNNKK